MESVEPTIEQVAKARRMFLQHELRGDVIYLVAKLMAERDRLREKLAQGGIDDRSAAAAG